MLSSKSAPRRGPGLETDKDTAFLRQLAERGNGRFYLTSDATTLPQIFSTETMKVAQSSLVEEPFMAVQMAKSPILAGLNWSESPLLLGYNATKPKPSADILPATERGEPGGHGRTARSSAGLRAMRKAGGGGMDRWPGFGKFWTQAGAVSCAQSDKASFEVTITRNRPPPLQIPPISTRSAFATASDQHPRTWPER